MARSVISVIICSWLVSVSAGCPALPSLRSDAVKQDFDPAKLSGLWYEHAYFDIAQVGAACQTLNASFNSEDQKVTMDFSVRYLGRLVPFTIKEIYTPRGESGSSEQPIPGLYSKNVDEPGGKWLTLPTVVVDVGHEVDGKYDFMILYSCLDQLGSVNIPFGAKLHALTIATREDTIDPKFLDALITTAHAQGVVFDDKSLNYVDHSKCGRCSEPSSSNTFYA
eukprot:TRINITY_DN2200_c0_g1_i1.p1 TRINITY_DN2200_c0_g1~~TRINITY_DN2200_c0_g1_i1.p1  ORF type:complete len:238 (+),score=18.18 TRINITY_DN2200_c0_g1_i1:46-714(+)